MSDLIYEKNFEFGKYLIYSDRPEMEVYKVRQVHGNRVVQLEDLKVTNGPLEADGIVCAENPIKDSIATQTADCLPILVAGKKGTALLHAGWRGVASEIFLTQEIMDIEPHYYFIGPHISVKHFEVQEDFKSNFPDSPNFEYRDNKLFFNLENEVRRKIGVVFPNAVVESSGICTFADKRYNSYRRNGTEIRNWNILTSL